MSPGPSPEKPDPIERFIARWQGHEGGQERANYALFLTELCTALDLPQPSPAQATHEFNDYVFERAVRRHRDEGDSIGRIDLYKRNSFVLEAKQSRQKGGKKEVAGVSNQTDMFSVGEKDEEAQRGRHGARRAWDVLMLNAKRQAEEYARALPVSHGWPPFILVCDVGHCIEVYADFSGQGKNYTQFPDRQSFRVYLEDLRKPEIQDRLRRIWQEPVSLDPTRTAAKVTREIAERLAAVSKSLEAKKYDAEEVAHFLMRCLFTMFAEDVKLLPENCFRELLDECRNKPDSFLPLLTDLWKSMNEGIYAPSIRSKVLRFNGNLFANAKVIPLGREEIGELYEAAQKDWHEVEPAIFGTLLEQALDPAERRRLGAHYTPRAYVERLVIATIIEPLREDWRNVQAAAETKRAAGDRSGAADEVKAFHDKLCATRVLDPACGTGNFLYVSMELMKRLEGEVLEALLDLGGQEALSGLGGHTIDPHQFLGLEINKRAAAIAELVLWIGYLQWHFRTKGGIPEEPILRQFRNIEVKNAVLTWDGYPLPQVVDGKEAYPNPKRPMWPEAEFIVGNPPFIGGKDLRARLGDAFTEALWAAHKHMNDSADFVTYWWDRAAETLTAKGSRLRRFGLVTTNSITQDFSRRIIKKRMEGKVPISLLLAIPDHAWTKSSKEAAAVRIAITVAAAGEHDGILREVIKEEKLDSDQPEIIFVDHFGRINSDLSVGIDVTNASALRANEGMSCPGVKLHGDGFIVTRELASHLGLGKRKGLDEHIREYRNGRDVTGRSRNALVIDLFGLTDEEVRAKYPEVYQHIKSEVKEKIAINKKGEKEYVGRDWNNRKTYRDFWWIFGEPRRELRPAIDGLSRYIATVETTKHRLFVFMSREIIPDNKLIVISSDDSFVLGILHSKIHLTWYLANAGMLGVYDREAVYVKSKAFEPYPFPSTGELLKSRIRAIAEELDAFRKERQKEHPHLTLTQMYNVLEKLKANAALDEDDERIKKEGLVLILKELHEKLDALVFEAYGWPSTLSDEQILEKLVALNHERAEEEKRGHVRWLRPDYQIPRFGKGLDKMAAKEEQVEADLGIAAEGVRKGSFPTGAVEQTAAVFAALASAKNAITVGDIAGSYRKTKNLEKNIAEVLGSLARLGHISSRDGKAFQLRRN